MKIVLKKNKLVSILIVLSFFSSLAITIAGFSVSIYTVGLYLCFLFFFFLKPKKYIVLILKFIKDHKSPFFYFTLYFCISLLNSCIVALFSEFNFLKCLLYLIAFILQIYGTIVISSILISKYVSNNNLVKIFVSVFYSILILGILDIIAYLLNIKFIQYIFAGLHTRWIFAGNDFAFKAMSGILPRMQSIYDEPSQFGWIIFMCSPVLLYLYLNKVKIFKNKILNIVIENTIIPLMYLDLICTFSPIMIIFTGISNGIIYILHFLKKLKQNPISYLKKAAFFAVFIVIILSVFYVKNNNIVNETSYALNRVTTVVNNIKSIDDIIIKEQSLGTRLYTIINNVIIFTKNPVIGIGFGQITTHMRNQIMDSPVSMNYEIYSQYINNKISSAGIGYRILCENGIIGFLLYTLMFVRLFKNIKLCKKKSENKKEFYFLQGLSISIISIYILFLYDIPFANPLPWVIIGISIAITKRISER